jgi:hypothetical protein
MNRVQLDTFDTLDDGWADLVENPAAAVGTLHAWERFKALWGNFMMTLVTNINHENSNSKNTGKIKRI